MRLRGADGLPVCFEEPCHTNYPAVIYQAKDVADSLLVTISVRPLGTRGREAGHRIVLRHRLELWPPNIRFELTAQEIACGVDGEGHTLSGPDRGAAAHAVVMLPWLSTYPLTESGECGSMLVGKSRESLLHMRGTSGARVVHLTQAPKLCPLRSN